MYSWICRYWKLILCRYLIILIIACPDNCGDCDSQLHCTTCKLLSPILNEKGNCDCPVGFKKDLN